jgi:hypothetical protein
LIVIGGVKNEKHIISVILVFVMVITGLPAGPVFGEEADLSFAETTDQENTGVAKRYSVLVLDRSGSMNDTLIDHLKVAARNFCNAVLNANGENYVAIVIPDNENK